MPCHIQPCAPDYLLHHLALLRIKVNLALASQFIPSYSHNAYFSFILALSRFYHLT